MQLWINFFRDGSRLLETTPNGDNSVPIMVPRDAAETLAAMLDSPERSEALALLFLDGVTTGERSARVGIVRQAVRLPARTH